jgi:nucleoside-triphosphatase THEP1
MLGYVSVPGRGAADRLIEELAASLQARGLRLAGTVQRNVEILEDRRCVMEIDVLGTGEVLRISQDLGPGARGCRLDVDALERAAGLVAASLERPVDLLILNKFGKQEEEGGGFRPLIGQALAMEVPVLIAVSSAKLADFLAFAGDLAEPVAADPASLLEWGESRISARRDSAAALT